MGGDENYVGKVPDDIQPRLQNVKMIFSTNSAFAALLNDDSVLAFGNPLRGGKIPKDIQLQLQKSVKTIFSTNSAFAALLNDGGVLAWGGPNFGGKIPDYIQSKLQNVQMIASTFGAFAALL